jgi:hypothetical protein
MRILSDESLQDNLSAVNMQSLNLLTPVFYTREQESSQDPLFIILKNFRGEGLPGKQGKERNVSIFRQGVGSLILPKTFLAAEEEFLPL